MILQLGIDTENGPFGHGETKVVRNLTKPPFVKKSIEVVSLMHCRRFKDWNDNKGYGYCVITRAVNQEPNDMLVSKSADRSRSEILISANIIRPLVLTDGKLVSDLVCITHMNSPGVPMYIAKKIGQNSAKNFVTDVRAVLEEN
uniref:START domain-containing protein n=1 Tax=Corethron hystrix TaxID=216773 RepID=A0A6U5IBT5_9STRA|mmetsp:Transcript_32893/g.75707  ORF Transcript_32893/g.75707 Transcript_32893/m.75707 type:complete len:144 (+) Transcript_32893:1672-2103(+)